MFLNCPMYCTIVKQISFGIIKIIIIIIIIIILSISINAIASLAFNGSSS